ncbi:MAG: zinc metallopeptidase [Deltaproteobacteria bacterium]|nr:zinc metallopeptidase [Deltaproteobacteria bacterium]
MNPTSIRLGVLPVGEVEGILGKTVAAHLLGYFHLEADLLPPLAPPVFAFDPRRLQYDAAAILRSLETITFQGYDKIVAILDVDLFVPILTHVFGEAQQGGRYALVSVYRLRGKEVGNPAPLPQLLERTAKVALHETGHLFHLLHCTQKKCLMHFSGDLRDLDAIPLFLCRYCSASLRDALRRFSG